MLVFYPLSCDLRANTVALAPGELAALAQRRSPTAGGQVPRTFLEFFALLVNLLPKSASL